MEIYPEGQLVDSFDILLVDDSTADARIFEAALLEAQSRARVYWVATAPEALDFLTNQGRFRGVGTIKLAVVDLNLPGEDGFSLLRSIKSHPVLNRVPVVMLSTSSAQHEIDLAYSLGANSYFRKPLSLEGYIDFTRTLVYYWLDLARLPTANVPWDPMKTDAERTHQSRDEI